MSDISLKVLVLAQDLSDPAVHRRVSMLCTGGASVTVAGFHRTSEPVASVKQCVTVNLGRTYNGRFIQRMRAVVREILLLSRHRGLFADADVVIARNLEMLAIAARGRNFCRPAPMVVYECLDIHRLLLRRDFIGAALRTLEGHLAQRASALFTSSPAFVSAYFNTLSQVRLPIRLVENKLLDTEEGTATSRDAVVPLPGPPWRIGWFGIIRCRKSLQILTDVVRQGQGSIEVVIRGRPDFDQLQNFHKIVAYTRGLQFLGPYKNPDDIASIYSSVHFTWAIDMSEEGLNSSWLRPNRLYEGGACGCVPIALEAVETGAFLKCLGIGVILKEPFANSLVDFFKQLSPVSYRALQEAVGNVPRSTWVYKREDCEAIVQYLRDLSTG